MVKTARRHRNTKLMLCIWVGMVCLRRQCCNQVALQMCGFCQALQVAMQLPLFPQTPGSVALRILSCWVPATACKSSKQLAHIKLCSFATKDSFSGLQAFSWLHPKWLLPASKTFCHTPWHHPLTSSSGSWHAPWPCCSACSHTHSWQLPKSCFSRSGRMY